VTDRPATLDDVLAELKAMRELLGHVESNTWRSANEAGTGGCNLADGEPVEVIVVEMPAPAKAKRARKAPGTAKG
jgi:hypothetical protein